ncbi:TIGR03862 family flavoprotein [Paracoccus sp. (in: a-proteobacteria)]|uniref:NAD(P)/FAD-dependent oxidoreductase n=1 Tax=Paracoccus sp. TaxID=267 RepID=UPI0026DFCB36|nr:TIGR03862 family flavoprotein [Paracoccus sp. (in: a-proteobacteria)]MDO5648607.1 TIGR03862 family flavoprotein [Paracoccus sp. (in: a-proteobacteria)]
MERVDALIIGAGPAGLMAAEVLAAPGRRVVVAEAMPTPARKFLMAGKSGLNLTRDQDWPDFVSNFTGGTGALPRTPGYFCTEDNYGPAQVMDWARGLGIDLFTGSTGRVFPVGMKASPLLRAWLARLRSQGVDLRVRWRWVGGAFRFDTPDGMRAIAPRVCVLAVGGASWPRLGSDAAWVPGLAAQGVDIADFRPANMGFRVDWSPHMAGHFGAAVKGVAIRVGDQVSRGEWVISRHGIEGGGVYAVAAAMRDGAAAAVDLAPDLSVDALAARFARPRGKLSRGNWLRRVLGDPVRVALVQEWGRDFPDTPMGWAVLAKSLSLRHSGPFGLERAISSAGGVTDAALTPELELRALPGVFAAGEMLDWEAPTGGYLLTGCLATGRMAGQSALRHLLGNCG